MDQTRSVTSARLIDDAIDSGSDTLTVENRLSLLTPSKEIINFYKRKVKNLENEQDFINEKLAQFRSLCCDQYSNQLKITQLQREISQLQKALSDLQDCFFQEQEANLKLQHEIKLCKTKDEKSFNEKPARGVVCHKFGSQNKILNDNSNNNSDLDSQKSKTKNDDKHLLLQIETLRTQIKEQSDLYKKKINSLLKEKDLKFEEMELSRKQDQERIEVLVGKLKRAQDLLFDTTRELARQREHQEREAAQWIEEKEKWLNGCDPSSVGPFSRGRSKDKSLQILTQKAKDAEKLSTAYRDQIIKLEDELNLHRVESDAKIKHLRTRLEKTTANLNSMTVKRKELDLRRKLEIEGYMTDISQLKRKLEDTETQFFKLAVCYSRNMGLECVKSLGDLDIRPKEVQKTTSSPNKIYKSVEFLKLKINDIESKLKQF